VHGAAFCAEPTTLVLIRCCPTRSSPLSGSRSGRAQQQVRRLGVGGGTTHERSGSATGAAAHVASRGISPSTDSSSRLNLVPRRDEGSDPACSDAAAQAAVDQAHKEGLDPQTMGTRVMNAPGAGWRQELPQTQKRSSLESAQTGNRALNTTLLGTERVGQGCVLTSPAFEPTAQPTLTEDGRRAPTLRLGDSRVRALARRPMHHRARRHRHPQ
jgi:hypothetical protein